MEKISIIKRLKNPGTLIAITSSVLLILSANGIKVADQEIMVTVKSICSILILLGIMNNPETDGLDIPGFDKKDKEG